MRKHRIWQPFEIKQIMYPCQTCHSMAFRVYCQALDLSVTIRSKIYLAKCTKCKRFVDWLDDIGRFQDVSHRNDSSLFGHLMSCATLVWCHNQHSINSVQSGPQAYRSLCWIWEHEISVRIGRRTVVSTSISYMNRHSKENQFIVKLSWKVHVFWFDLLIRATIVKDIGELMHPDWSRTDDMGGV